MGFHRCRTSNNQTANLQLIGAAVDGDLFAIQEDIEHILTNSWDSRVLVIDAGNPDCCDSSAFKVAHQHTPKGISQGCGLASLKGANEKYTGLRAIVSDLMLDTVDLVLQHGLKRGREGPERGRAGSDAPTLGTAAAVVRQGG